MGRNDKILLLVGDSVDEETDVARVVKNHLEHELVVIHDGIQALDYLFGTGDYTEQKAVDLPVLVMLDLQLVRRNEFEVLRRIRSDARTRCVPVVVYTSAADEQDILDSYAHGANSYICKTADFAQFSEDIRQVLGYWFGVNQPPPIRIK